MLIKLKHQKIQRVETMLVIDKEAIIRFKNEINAILIKTFTTHFPKDIIAYWNHEILHLEHWLLKNMSFMDILDETNVCDEFIRNAFFEVFKPKLGDWLKESWTKESGVNESCFKESEEPDPNESYPWYILYKKIEFLNQPYFHWEKRFETFVQPEIYKLIPTVHPTDIYLIVGDIKKWLLIANIINKEFEEKIIEIYWKDELVKCIEIAFEESSESEVKQAPHLILDPGTLECVYASDSDYWTCNIHSAIAYLVFFANEKQLISLEKIIYTHIISKYKNILFEKFIEIYEYYCNTFSRLSLSIIRAFQKITEAPGFIEKYVLEIHNGIINDNYKKLKSIVGIVDYIVNKDVLQVMLKSQMSRRLLTNIYRCDEIMITECSSLFTDFNEELLKVKRMFTNCKNPIEFSFGSLRNLHSYAWDLKALNDVPQWKIPKELESSYEDCLRYIGPHKKLHFVVSHDSIVLTFGHIELTMTSVQASVLFLFNEASILSFETIVEKTGISAEFLRRVLDSLDSLIKCENSSYVLLDSFESTPVIKEITYIEKVKKTEVVELNRKYAIESAIVRLMKRKKTMDYRTFKKEICSMITLFEVENTLLEKTVESLIERDYIELANDVISYVD